MLNSLGYNQQSSQQVEPQFIWLDYLVLSNPQNIMQVLSKNGYAGYLAPQDQEELREATYDFVEKKGDKAIIALVKAHPLYDIIVDISNEEKSTNTFTSFKNADGSESSVISTIKALDYKKVFENIFVIIGAIYLADKVWGLFKQE